MPRRPSLKDELETLREELATLRASAGEKLADAKSAARDAKDRIADAVDEHSEELNKAVGGFFKDAEDLVADHPLATVAGALVVGILIGRLTSR
ncbi:MAG: hypothetical protein LCH46_09650 [Proteobacteria bacterium]|nr:hypothetical protein [Pseudomonadota bacterium]